MLSMDSPDERKIKHVLVTINWTSGGVSWRLAPAVKVGRFYQIDESVFTDMQRDYWQGRSLRSDLDVSRSFHSRPPCTYREWGASQTISDTGPVPIK